MFSRLVPIALLMGLAAAPCAGAATNTTPLPTPDPSYAHLAQDSDYRIGPLDKLHVAVFQVDDLKTDVQVDASGNIALPLIGTLSAAGKTAQELSSEIAGRLSAKYLQSPQVTVTVEEAESQRVTVGGSVIQPGVYDLHGRTTLLQAVALAHGVDTVADLKHVTVFRTVNGQRLSATVDLRPIQKGQAEDPQVYGDDIIMVGMSGFKDNLRTVGSAMPILDLLAILHP